MFKPIKAILFATNLSQNCKRAFDYAAALATQFQATIVLLHVIEKMPDYVEGRLKGLLGKNQWNDLLETHEKGARQFLIGKKSSNAVIQAALSKFCSEAGIDDASCGYHSREIVVVEGDIVEEILQQSQKYDCDLIIMGAREGFFTETSIGTIVKSVMKKSTIPVMVVPPDEDDEQEES